MTTDPPIEKRGGYSPPQSTEPGPSQPPPKPSDAASSAKPPVPDDLSAVIRQDAAVFELIARWANAPTATATNELNPPSRDPKPMSERDERRWTLKNQKGWADEHKSGWGGDFIWN